MRTKNRILRSLSLILVAALILPTASVAAGPGSDRPSQAPLLVQEATPAFDSGLYRTTIMIRNPTDWTRIEEMGVLVLERLDESGLLLVDDQQLETLARLQLQPRASDELGELLRAQGPDRAWLSSGLQPLVDQGKALPAQLAAAPEAASLADQRQQLRDAMHALTVEQVAALGDSFSVDDDGDGLTNTEEAWWCTDPMNPNSDGDANGYTDGQEVAALLDFSLPRDVRWSYGPPFGPPNPWPNFNNQNGSGVNVCNDGDWDTIPDYAEAYVVGTRVGVGNSENTDGDKFDDGQEFFGTTYCPGGSTTCGYGSYPRTQDYSFITSGMPSWVRPPGDSPFVAAYPVIEFLVDPATIRVVTREIRTSERTITQGEEISTGFAETTGSSTTVGTIDTNTHSTWQENSTTEGGIEPGLHLEFAVASESSANGTFLLAATEQPEVGMEQVPVHLCVVTDSITISQDATVNETELCHALQTAIGTGSRAADSGDSGPILLPDGIGMMVTRIVQIHEDQQEFAVVYWLPVWSESRVPTGSPAYPLLGQRVSGQWDWASAGTKLYDQIAQQLPDSVEIVALRRVSQELLTMALPAVTTRLQGFKLPWTPSAGAVTVTQGELGSLSHQNRYAYDFARPVDPRNFSVIAIKGGKVIAMREDSDVSCNDGVCVVASNPTQSISPPCASNNCQNEMNYVTIEHADGTTAHYWHLQKDSIPFRLGDRVFQGEPIGKAGRTGYSTNIHLHLEVRQNGTTVPIGFDEVAEREQNDGQPIEGHSYNSQNHPAQLACYAPGMSSAITGQPIYFNQQQKPISFGETIGKLFQGFVGKLTRSGSLEALTLAPDSLAGCSGNSCSDQVRNLSSDSLNFSDNRSAGQCSSAGGSPGGDSSSGFGGGGTGVAINNNGDGTWDRLRVWSQTTTSGEGFSTSHSELRSQTEYSEITRSQTNTLVSSEAWSTATTVDPTQAATLTFNYNLYNTGSDAAVQLTGVRINVLIGDLPVITWNAPDRANILPGQAKGPFGSDPINLTLDQLAAIDNGAPIRVVLADYGYNDSLYDQDAWGRGVLFHVDDGIADGDESSDTYLITTGLVQGETYQDVLARYFPVEVFDAGPNDPRTGTLTNIRTPEFDANGEITGWNDHRVGEQGWWELAISLGGETDGVSNFKDMPAKPRTDVYLRYVEDSDGDGYSDRAEIDGMSDPNNPDIHPRPLMIAAQHRQVSGSTATVQLALQNIGNFDASSVEVWAVAPDDSITLTDNLIGGGGRVEAGGHVVLGARTGNLNLTNWATGSAKPYPAGQYTGLTAKTFTLRADANGNIGSTTGLTISWSTDGATWTPLAVGAGYTPLAPLPLSDGLTVAFSTGYIAQNETFSFQTALPIDTFSYTINRTPHTPPLIVVSYNDPAGNHKFVSDVEVTPIQADLTGYLGQMRYGFELDIMAETPAAPGANTAYLVFTNPADQTVQEGKLFVEFALPDGTVVKEYVLTDQTFQPGPNVVALPWNTADFTPVFDPSAEYHILVFAADRQGTIFENTVKKLAQVGHDQLPLAVLPDSAWNFGAAQQGTLLKHTIAVANVGYHDLLTFVQGNPGFTLSDSGTRHLPGGDLALYELTLNTVQLPVGPFQSIATIRTSDPTQPSHTVTIQGTVNSMPADVPPGAVQRPLDWPATFASGTQGQWMEFTHTLGPEPLASLHPVKVFNDTYTTLHGVGRYATHFGTGTYAPEMFGDGRDGSLVVGSGQTHMVDIIRAAVAGTASAGQISVSFSYPSGGVSTAYLNYWPKYDWFDTGLKVTNGDNIVITKDEHGNPDLGKICYGGSGSLCYMADGISELAPAGWIAPGIRKFSLVGRIGNGSPFYVGKNFNGTAGSSGTLYLGLNDCAGCHSDNTREWWFTHQVLVYPATYASFAAGDIVLIVQMTGTNAGKYETAKVASAGSGWLNLSAPLQNTYTTSGNSKAQIIRVPQFTSVTVQNGGLIAAHSWSESTGGIVAMLVRDQLSVQAGGQISTFALGFNGGRETTWSQPNSGPAYQGASYTGAAQQTTTAANGGGGGGGQNDGGGGGGFGTAGQSTVSSAGGSAYGQANLATLFMGSGGGGSGHYYGDAAQGGKGGGMVVIIAKNLTVGGTVNSGGQGGWQGPYGGDYPAPTSPAGSTRNGGGGAGGSVKLTLGTGSLGQNLVTALGGQGGRSTDGGGHGGNGGVGRIRVEYCDTVTGSTNPVADSQRISCFIAEQVETSPFTRTRLNLPESFTSSRTYRLQYGRRMVYTGAANQDVVLRVPAGAFNSATIDALISGVGTGSLTVRIDVGNDSSLDWEWTGTVNDAIAHDNIDLAAAFNRYWAIQSTRPLNGTLDVPVQVYLSKAGQVLLTDVQVTPSGSRLRHVRLSALDYDEAVLGLTAGQSGSGDLTVAADVGDNGSVDWAWSGSATYPQALTAGNLATAINAYLQGQTGEVDVPIRFYVSPFVEVNLQGVAATPAAQPDVSIGASDIAFSASTPSEGDVVTVTATLHNFGSLDSGPLTASFFATPAGGLERYIGSAFVPTVPPSSSSPAAIPWNTLGFTGDVSVRVVVDPYNRVVESDEDNNQANKPITILTRPDLEVTSVTLSDDEPVAGETIDVTLGLANHGQTTAAPSTLALYAGHPDSGGALICEQPITVAGNGQDSVTCPWTTGAPGPLRLLAMLDRDDVVKESNEGNNATWHDAYVGLAGPLLLDSGSSTNDPAYTPARGFGVVDEGQPDIIETCGGATTPEDTLRRDPGGRLVYRFDHLLPGHFYHLDVTLRQCDNIPRQEHVYVDNNLVAGPVDLGDTQARFLSLLLDPALYADHAITVAVEAAGGDGALVAEVNLYDIDYRYADAGGGRDPEYPGLQGYGWLDGVSSVSWGSLPYQSARINQTANQQSYRFDGLQPGKRYMVNLTYFQSSGAGRQQRVEIDGLATGLVVNTGDYTVHRGRVFVPGPAYTSDGSIIVRTVRSDAGTTGAMVNEISLEELTVRSPDIALSPTGVTASQAQGVLGSQPLIIDNIGNANLNWTISEALADCVSPGDVAWLSVNPASGTTSGGSNTDLTVALDTRSLAPAIYTAQLCISSNDPDQPILTVPVDLTVTPATDVPRLAIPTNVPGTPYQMVTMPVQFTRNGTNIATTIFSVDFDQTCLAFDPTDDDGDGLPDAVTFNLSAAFQGSVTFDAGDSDGELDFYIGDTFPPLAALPDGTPATIEFQVICQSPPGSPILARVGFSSQPAASFGGTNGASVPGVTSDGSVEIQSGTPGDCNADTLVDAGDITALVLEIFDGDGSDPASAPGGTFPGSAVGCNSNQDAWIDAGDISCTVLTIFNGPNACGGGLSLEGQATVGDAPVLSLLEPKINGDRMTVPILFSPGDYQISSVVFALDYSPAVMGIDPTDADGNGIPDAVAFNLPPEFVAAAIVDQEAGQLQVMIADVSAPLAALPEQIVTTVTWQTKAAATGLIEPNISMETLASFGDTRGRHIPGTANGSYP